MRKSLGRVNYKTLRIGDIIRVAAWSRWTDELGGESPSVFDTGKVKGKAGVHKYLEYKVVELKDTAVNIECLIDGTIYGLSGDTCTFLLIEGAPKLPVKSEKTKFEVL